MPTVGHPEACPCCHVEGDLFLPPSVSATDEAIDVPQLVDTHNHAHLDESNDAVAVYDNFLTVTCAIRPNDWNKCRGHASASRTRWAAIGVHPWYVHEHAENWNDILRSLDIMFKNERSLLIGEVGLDGACRWVRSFDGGKTAALKLQSDCLTSQLLVAAKHRRPVSVHCVQLHALLLEALQNLEEIPPAIALHSFSGTKRHLQQYLDWECGLLQSQQQTRLFFGFSHYINNNFDAESSSARKQHRQTLECIREVPLDHLLLESDMVNDCAAATRQTLDFVAKARGMAPADVAAKTTNNALAFLATVTPST